MFHDNLLHSRWVRVKQNLNTWKLRCQHWFIIIYLILYFRIVVSFDINENTNHDEASFNDSDDEGEVAGKVMVNLNLIFSCSLLKNLLCNYLYFADCFISFIYCGNCKESCKLREKWLYFLFFTEVLLLYRSVVI